MAISATSIKGAQRWAHRSGVVLLMLCASMTFAAGWQLGGDDGRRSFVFGSGFAIITLAAGILLPFIELAFSKGSAIAGLAIMLAWCSFTTGEFAGHLMVVAGQRHGQIDSAEHQDVKFEDQRKSIAENEELARTLTARKSEIEAGKGTGTGWTSTRDVAAWEADIANAEGDRIYKRSKQCGNVTINESREFCDKLKELRANLAAAKKMAAAEEQLVATNRKLESLRKEAATIARGNSVARTQSDVVASLVTASLNPDGSAKRWSNLGLEVFFAFLLTIGPMSLIYVGAKDWDAPKKQRKAWNLFARLVNAANYIAGVFGTQIPGTTRTITNTVHHHHAISPRDVVEGRATA